MSTKDWRDIPRDRYSAAANHADDLRLLEMLMENAARLNDYEYEMFGNLRDKVRIAGIFLKDRHRRLAEQTAETLAIPFTPREMDQ